MPASSRTTAWPSCQRPVVLHRYLRPQRHPHGRRLRHLRRQRQAERPVLGRRGQARTATDLPAREAKAKRRLHRAGRRQRHRRPEDRGREGHRYRRRSSTGREVAGKTGTTDGNKSAWFVGYTPQLSTAISMFRMDDDETNKKRKFLEMYGTGGQEKIHGASFPAEIWHDYMDQALKGDAGRGLPEAASPSARSSTTTRRAEPDPLADARPRSRAADADSDAQRDRRPSPTPYAEPRPAGTLRLSNCEPTPAGTGHAAAPTPAAPTEASPPTPTESHRTTRQRQHQRQRGNGRASSEAPTADSRRTPVHGCFT